MAAVYTISAIDANTAEITTQTKKWRSQVGAVTYVDLETQKVMLTFGNVNMQLSKETIITVGGNPPDEDPSVLCDQISACFPAVGTVTITPSVTIDGGFPTNSSVEILPTTPIDGEFYTPDIQNDYASAVIFAVRISNIDGSFSGQVFLDLIDKTLNVYIEMGIIANIANDNPPIAAYVVAPYSVTGSLSTAFQASIPASYRLRISKTGGEGTGDIQITANYSI